MKLTVILNEDGYKATRLPLQGHEYIGSHPVKSDGVSWWVEFDHMPMSLDVAYEHYTACIIEASGPHDTAPHEGAYMRLGETNTEQNYYATLEVNQKGWYLRIESPSFETACKLYGRIRRREIEPDEDWRPLINP